MTTNWLLGSFRTLLAGAVATTAFVAAAPSARAQETIKIDGSSTVYPVTEAVAEEFQKEKKGKVRVTVGISGTGGGFKKFVRGEIDNSTESRPILEAEMTYTTKNGAAYIVFSCANVALSSNDVPQST